MAILTSGEKQGLLIAAPSSSPRRSLKKGKTELHRIIFRTNTLMNNHQHHQHQLTTSIGEPAGRCVVHPLVGRPQPRVLPALRWCLVLQAKFCRSHITGWVITFWQNTPSQKISGGCYRTPQKRESYLFSRVNQGQRISTSEQKCLFKVPLSET